MLRRIGLALGCFFLIASQVWAASFVVRDIRVEGLQRISAGTVFNYLPVRIGEEFNDERFGEAIRSLYKTGFFKDIRLERDGDVLVIFVQERPSIAEITFSGNKDFESEALIESLKGVGFATGRVFDKSILERVEQELGRQYFSEGKYSVRITSTVTPLERNRVAISINISEGLVTRIKQINIVGNEVFDDKTLRKRFKLTTPTTFSFYTKDDQYSKAKLAADLETLSAYYQNRGYLKFRVLSTQVSITPDKKDVYITINVSESEQYKVKEVKVSGKLFSEDEVYYKKIGVRAGDTFSRRAVTNSQNTLTDYLGNEGYAFANVNTIPEIDESNKEVSLTFFIDLGKRVYVRRVNFSGNTRTRDEVLRREMRQMEGGWFSTQKVERSRVRLERLGYFNAVNVETPAVPGSPDQVDVEFSVDERSSGLLLAGIGFSQSGGLTLNANVSQNNFLGTGKRVTLNFNNSDFQTSYVFAYTNPYWTVDGVSRGFRFFLQERDLSQANISDYATNNLGASISFGIPISEYNAIGLSLTYESVELKQGAVTAATPQYEVTQFVAANGNTYDQFSASFNWNQDTRNGTAFLANRGAYQRFSAELAFPGSDLEYYKLEYRQQRFYSLTRNLTLLLNGEMGYGDGYSGLADMPLTKHFFTGGVRSVRGFKDFTLGPRDFFGDPIGGDLKLVGNVEVLFPVPFVSKQDRSLQMSGFLDIGNVYKDFDDFEVSELRYSVGVGLKWLSPFGPFSFSLAQPLNDKSRDQVQNFQFTLGQTF